jgi:ketosteroid isomerase-like protein
MLDRLNERFWHTRAFGDFWEHVLVAEGALEAAVDPVVNLWDVAALMPIVEEAGGRITTLAGERDPAGGSAVTTNGLVHDELLELLRSGPLELGRRFVDAFNGGRLDELADVLAPDVAFSAHGDVLGGGREAVVEALRRLREAFEGARFELEREIVAGTTVTHVVRLKGRHTGAAFAGVEPAGTEISVHHIWIIDTDRGAITAVAEAWDRLGLLRGLGGDPPR